MRERSYTFDPQKHRAALLAVFAELLALRTAAEDAQPSGPLPQPLLHRVLRRHPRDGSGLFSRSQLIAGYRALHTEAGLHPDPDTFATWLRMRPVRTHSGVMPVTVLSKPFPCPGQCVFCPSDVRMPKSYLSDEPGCQRAAQHGFDPYLQTWSRMAALSAIGHSPAKVELIVLGGTWSFYPEAYQRWFIKRCFDAINDFGIGRDGRAPASEQRFSLLDRDARPDGRGTASYNRRVERHLRMLGGGVLLREFEDASWDSLVAAQQENEHAPCRCVGLTLETRPDYVDWQELCRLRKLGCTRVQIGYQSLSDEVLVRNKRGHDVAAIRRAMALLRGAGFKVLAHFMPNLLGATPEGDIAGYRLAFDDPDFRPDEMKVYPCSLIESAELMDFYHGGDYRPYGYGQLLEVLCEVISSTPRYCRLSRVIRDICSGDIVAGNRRGNFREIAERALDERGIARKDIRSREVGVAAVTAGELGLRETRYEASGGHEVFLEFVTRDDRIAAFCRLRLPKDSLLSGGPLSELAGRALIRELHVYGTAQPLGARGQGRVQHRGLGRQLLEQAAALARAEGYGALSVISAVGTRAYYRQNGFADGPLYQHCDL